MSPSLPLSLLSTKKGRRTSNRLHHLTRKSPSAQAAATAVISDDPDPSLSSTSSTLVLGRSLSSSYSSSAHGLFETIPEDQEVLTTSTHSLGRSTKSSAVPALSHRQRMDALDLSSPTSKGSGKVSKAANWIELSSHSRNLPMTGLFNGTTGPSRRRSSNFSSSSSSPFDIDTFHVGLNLCDAERLPTLRRLRESNPIVITEDDDEVEESVEHAGGKAGARMLPYQALQVFPGASYWWYHPYYYPTSALMRGQT